MKKLIMLFALFQVGLAQANSEQLQKDRLSVAEKAVYGIELAEELGMAKVEILDAFMDKSGKAYVTSEISFADESGLKIMSCWEVEFAEADLVQSLARLAEKACR